MKKHYLATDLSFQKKMLQDLPGGTVVESTCQCRRHRFDSRPRKIPHAAEQLGSWATTENDPNTFCL